jgi:hypothetical protein
MLLLFLLCLERIVLSRTPSKPCRANESLVSLELNNPEGIAFGSPGAERKSSLAQLSIH